MITITRSLARQLRAVFRRAGCGKAYGGYGKRALFLADHDTLRIRAMSGSAAVEYQAAYQGSPVQALLPFDLLAACEGSKPDAVQLDFSVPDKVTASWTDKRVPVMLDFDVSAPDDALPSFPPLPSSFATNEPDLWTSLREASASTDPNPTRAALGCIQFRGSEGKLIATDGRQLLVQSGFVFPWTEDVLVPASNVFGCRELHSDQQVHVGRTEDWATFRIGPWSISLKLEKDAHFPDVVRHLSDPSMAMSRLRLANIDSDFLTDALPRLPCEDDTNRPITLDLNGQVLIRGKAADQSRATELTLSNSRLEGDPITVNSNREYLLRALRLGFREVHLFANDVPVLCDDGRRQFLWAVLEPKAVIPTGPDLIHIESPRHQETGANGAHKPRRSKPVMSEPTTPVTTATTASRDKSPAKRKRSAAQAQGVIEQTIALRDALRVTVVQANELIRVLKQQKRESRIVRSTLDSLRQLQKVGV